MRFLSLIHALIGLTSLCGAAPAGKVTLIESSESTSSTLASARKLPDDIGLPSELAWEAWLLIAKKPDVQSSFESATVPRRISPKSIFVAPSLEDQSQCSDGYTRNESGHCVQDMIKITRNSLLEFYRKRFNMFPPKVHVVDSAAVDSGPIATVSEPVRVDLGNRDDSRTGPLGETTEGPLDVEISVVRDGPVQGSGPSKEDEALMTLYEVGNSSTSDGRETETFFRGNSTKNFHDLPERGVVVPVVYPADSNHTLTKVIDKILNGSGTELVRQAVENITELNLGGDAQPNVILLLSPSRRESSTSFPERTEPSETSEVATAQEAKETTLANDGIEVATTTEPPAASPTTIYPKEDSDDFTESNDEILLHGEAGMMVSGGKLASSTSPAPTPTKTEEGNVSSKSSISGDTIMETTLLDLSPGSTPSRPDLDDIRELFEAEKIPEFEPEVVSSPQDSHGSFRPGSGITKRTGDPAISPTSQNNPQESARYVLRQTGEGASLSDRSHPQNYRTISGQNRVRFPDDPRPQGFVSFPSDHQSNSINGNLDYKEAPSVREESPRVQPVPKSVVPPGKHKTYYGRLPPGWRVNDPKRQAAARTGNQQLQNQMLLRFWTRMPLFRDPSMPIGSPNLQSSRIPTMVNGQRDNAYRDQVLGQTVRSGQVQIG